MTLNDNPRVDAEKRLKQLRNRLELVGMLTSHRPEFNNGMVSRLYLNPKIGRGRDLMNVILKEIREKEKFLSNFKLY